LWLGLLAACATGKPAPAVTPLAEVRTGLEFQFGMGEYACGIPTPTCPTSTSFDPGEPELQVKLKPFALDVHEVTNEQYNFCVQMEVCSQPAGDNGPNGVADYHVSDKFRQHPVLYVTWQQAKEYCEFVGKRLPTEFEWERVAGGPAQSSADKVLFPGTKGPLAKLPDTCEVNVARCNAGLVATRAAMTSAADVVAENGVQVFDLTGNVSEWTASDADEDARKLSATCDWAQPYDCAKCVDCLKTNPAATCKPACLSCNCGTGGAATKPNCYIPCGTPICPRHPKSSVPVDKSFTGKNTGAQRVVRGGSYFSHPASNNAGRCDGRSDLRVLLRAPDAEPLPYLGFRCAKTL